MSQKQNPQTTEKKNTSKENLESTLQETLGLQNQEKQDDVEYMPPLSAAYQRRPSQFAPILLFSILGFFVIALIWANWASLDEVTRGDGRVIPSSQIKMIDHLEGGIVRKILIKSGQSVEAGQLLLTIDNTVAQSRYEETEMLFYRAFASVTRLRAQTENKPFVVPQVVEEKAPAIAIKETERYQATQQRMTNEKEIAKQEIAQRQQELLELQGRATGLEEQHKLAEEELNITAPLAKQGIVAKVDVLRLRREVNDIKANLESTKVNIIRAQAALEGAQQRLMQVGITMHNEDLRELREAERRLSEMRDSLTAESDKLQRTDVRSPVKGIIKELMVHTIGGVVQPGQDLIAIVPIEDTLLIEAQIRPADVAFLRPGMPAVIKITAYDFAIFGGLDGKLVDISADAIKDEEGNDFFRVRLKTDKNHLTGRRGEKLPIIPGMMASIDIMTGKKTVLEYLLKPIHRGMNVAMTER
ncbi:MAG: HlyD family type I secretion periplasmic adaptor subunit [Pseudomonadota bacterium]